MRGQIRIDVPDTVGTATPESFSELIDFIKSNVSVPLSTHCHDDYGLAVANSLAGINAGADQAHVTINGLGERAGNAALEEFVMAATRLYNFETGINTKLLYSTSGLVAKDYGSFRAAEQSDSRRECVRSRVRNSHSWRSESACNIRAHGTRTCGCDTKNPGGEARGFARSSCSTAHSGDSSDPGGDQEYSPDRVKIIGDQGKTSQTWISTGLRERSWDLSEAMPFLKISDLAVITGIKTVPTASVRLTIGDDQTMTVAETGTGPVDAVFKAIQKVTDRFTKVRLREYKLEAITGGTDAEAEVLVKIEDEEGHISTASSVGTDIVMTSVDAMISGINEVMLRSLALRNAPK